MAKPTIHGPAFSTYVRSCRLTCLEKGVDAELKEFNFLEGWPDGYEQLHPFLKVPAFEHDGVKLFETPAIMSYINTAFAGPELLPGDAASRAKAVQVVNIIDSYGYDALIARTFIPRAVVPMLGGTTDESVIDGAKADAQKVIDVLNGLVHDSFFTDSLSLADLHVIPVMHYASQIPEGQALLEKAPKLSAWLDKMNQRDSVKATVPVLG